MFDFMIKRLNNGRVLLRNLDTKENEVMKATELIEYLENQLQDQIKAQDEEDTRTLSIRSDLSGASEKPSK
jgi:hypothetical protein|tara:strand:- start:95 stop:307 length:213 start_codon:yes stop_codon:yes gene_type:complete